MRYLKTRRVRLLTATLLLALGSGLMGANCALRNPNRQIFEMFPGATNYRTVVINVDAKARRRVEAILGSKISFNDLGKHTIYVVLKDKAPVGIVHARSEIGSRGVVELVWAYDLDLNLRDFRVQRSRERRTSEIKTDVFKRHLVGKGLWELKLFLRRRNSSIDLRALGMVEASRSIAHLAVLSGVKTRIITQVAFATKVFSARLLGNVTRFFPTAAKPLIVRDAAAPAIRKAAAARMGSELTAIDLGSLIVVRVLDEKGAVLGALAFCRARGAKGEDPPEVWWAVDGDGVTRGAVVVGRVTKEAERALRGLKGQALGDALANQASNSLASIAWAKEILSVLSAHGFGS